MKKRVLALALSLFLLAALLPAPALAYGIGTVGQANIVSAGSSYTGFVDKTAALWTWGWDSNGRLGNGSDFEFEITVPGKVLDNVAAVSCGYCHTAAIKTDGTLWTWGNNTYGQLGNGTTKDSNVPIKVLDNVAAVSCGYRHTAAIKTDGTLWMWGENEDGELGNGTTKASNVPVKVLDNVAAVSCGMWYTAAIKTDGTLWMWGINDCGQLGSSGGNAVSGSFLGLSHTPIQNVPAKIMDNVAAVSCGAKRTAAIKTDGTLWMWGYTGKGFTGTVKAPEKVLDNVASVSCGDYHTAAIKTDGTLWMWGYNDKGQLGNGTTEDSNVPVKVLDNVAAVSCGYRHTVAVKTDGTLWTWGENTLGVLGNDGVGTEVSMQTSPMLVAGLTAAVTGVSSASIAYARTQTVLLDGKSVTFQTYVLKDSKGGVTNYIKLRDLAYYLNGTKAQFSVDWQAGQISLTRGQPYIPNGSELSTPFSGDRAYRVGTNQTVVDDFPSSIISSIVLTDDEGGAYTYYQLRDMGRNLGFNVSYINGQVVINTNETYSDEQ